MASSHYITLNDGKQTPRIAYGSGTAWFQATGPDGISPALVEATSTAISIGFTHLDAAKVYGNERSTGVAISQCGMPRDKLFITTKIMSGLSSVKETLRAQLRDLQVDYVDLYLIHSPMFTKEAGEPTLAEAWKSMEEVQQEGLAKSIGVSNYRISDLNETLKSAKVKPAVNQIEFHPYVWKEAEPLLKYMKEEGITLAAYGPQVPVVKLPGGKVDPLLERISSERKISTGEVLLKWAKAHGAIVVTTSSKATRMKSMLDTVLDEKSDLSPSEVQELNGAGIANGVQRVFMKHMSD
ncbi:hypothetical protein PTTG_08304 [Puccinia triticina 1-1 BBBD Race 1]|uniref:Aldo_ket_red domain-containing protein n=2 Tax=Puccinia triticina TaxID=208348 RepID=A0A180GCV0_PUCT1|nr:uncharacterized protein PtA15_11A369 [Puccinia triticina]OAV90556.1 hypothetical protein PTTG_08304 [Puccinia triticina 1-1 BBBD Race 1]WAQ89678.1 hypothetical protein PtA15_11A369 [Puccinia triticina]WAR59714.1 hypothetical protein PtB15_11B354 [Puccinia triticina]